MLSIKMQQESGAIQSLLPAFVHSQEVTSLLQVKVSPTGKHKLI